MKFQPILKNFIEKKDYQSVDLSKATLENLDINPQHHQSLSKHLAQIKDSKNAKVLYGGYLEKRSLYNQKSLFQQNEKQRNIHIGMDFWADAGEDVLCPVDAIVHSFADNAGVGNYGACIILEHQKNQQSYYTLYGHLSRESFEDLHIGKVIHQNQVFCSLGNIEENGGYVPHLHFQIIKDIQNFKGDYPGVCHEADLGFYKRNTLNPKDFLDL